MRRIIAAGVAVGIATVAWAKPAVFTVTNASSWTIAYVYLSSTSMAEWGPDQLGDSQTIATGQTFQLYKIPCDSYDLKIVTSEGVECVLNDIRMCRDASSYTITDDSLASCGGGYSGEGGGGSIDDLLAQLAADPANDELMGDLGDAYAAAGESTNAAQYYMMAFRTDPGDSEWRTAVVNSGGTNEAVAYLTQRLDPTDDEKLGDLADLLFEAGRTSDACPRWKQAYDIQPDDSEWGPKLSENCPQYGIAGAAGSSGEQIQLGLQALAAGDKATAQKHFDDALLKDPTNKEALFGMVLATGRNSAEILAGLQGRVTESDEVWGDLGDAWMHAGNPEKAREAYLRAAVLDPEDAEWKRALEILGVSTPH